MHPVNDVDALVLLSTALSSKRRPAELTEIVAGVELLNTTIPSETKLIESFERLAVHDLIRQQGEGYTLTPTAEAMVAELPRKAAADERLFIIRDNLTTYTASALQAPIVVDAAQLGAAIAAHQAAAKEASKNLLVPKPKPEAGPSRPGQRARKPMPPRKRKV